MGDRNLFPEFGETGWSCNIFFNDSTVVRYNSSLEDEFDDSDCDGSSAIVGGNWCVCVI